MTSYPISFIIPAFNCADTLPGAVSSVYDHNFEPGDEIIIVNDASTDNTQEVIDALRQRNPEIVALRHRINKGSAAAGRNTAIDHAKNFLYFSLDADNILEPGSVPRLKAYFFETIADAAAFGELHFFSGSTKRVTHKWVFKEGPITLSDALSGHLWPGPSGNYLFSRDSWLRAGRYHEAVGGAYDSWAFGVRQLATGSKMVVLKDTFYYHRVRDNSSFLRDKGSLNPCLVGLQILLPFLHMIEDEDVEYIMGPEGRYRWFENLAERPLRAKNLPAGKTGSVSFLKGLPLLLRARRKGKSILNAILLRR
jgi:glycosyltransferase involved in cell wall biosynthesis